MTDDTREVHEHVLSLLNAEEATGVLDLGCGNGEHLLMLGQAMSASARLVGLDFRDSVLEQGRSSVESDRRFAFVNHDINERLPFEDDEFDRVLSVNALEAIPAKDAFVREAHRVLKPGGRLVCAHYDWESQLYDGSDKDVVRRIVQAFASWQLSWMATSDGWMGRRLWRTFEASGLFQGRMDAFTHTSTTYAPGHYGWERSKDIKSLIKRGMISQREYDLFIEDLEKQAAQHRFFYAITMFSYVGVKSA
jgi:SAM-dependent methyltransferase